MGGVDVAVNICLEGGIDSNKSKSADNLRVVGSLLRTKQHLVVEEIEVSKYFRHLALYQTQRAAGGELTVSCFDEVHNRVLYHLRVHLKRRDVRVLTQFTEDGVRHIAHTGLNRQEGLRDTSFVHLFLEE